MIRVTLTDAAYDAIASTLPKGAARWPMQRDRGQCFIQVERAVVDRMRAMRRPGESYLKHYIDVIHQPGLLWGLKPESGYFGPLEKKHATLVLTAGVYATSFLSPAFGVDYQLTCLRAWLNQAGVTDIDQVRFQPTLLTQDPAGDFERAKQAAVDLATAHERAQIFRKGDGP